MFVAKVAKALGATADQSKTLNEFRYPKIYFWQSVISFQTFCAKLMPETFFLRTLIALTLATLVPTESVAELTVNFRSGTSLTGEVGEQLIAWTSVAPNGMVSQFNYSSNQIKSLSLAKSESSAQMIQIRQLLRQLGDAEYQARESAEEQLTTIGGQFRSVVETFLSDPSFEVRYRVKRLMSDSRFKSSPSVKREVDRIVLKDGTILEGEASKFSLSLYAYGKTIELNRQMVSRLSDAQPQLDANNEIAGDGNGDPVAVELFHRYEGFNTPDQTEFRFDAQADGKKFGLRTNLDEYFKDDGLLFKNAGSGFVGISSYDFKFDPLPVGGRSVGLYGTRRGNDLRGIMEITFCEPGNPSVSAGVYEFGTFIAKVSFRRDIILEAYGADGQLLATVEGTDQKCVFAGVKSNELITKVRILSNPYLKKIERKIDDDFTIDTLRMSKPIVTDVYRIEGQQQVTLKNSDVIDWSSMNITKDSELRMMVAGVSSQAMEFLFPISDVRRVSFGRSVKTTTAWQAQLDDGSRVNMLPGKTFRAEMFGFSVPPKDFVGCWPAVSPPRFPVEGDFSDGSMSPLIVFPTCRLRTKSVKFASDRLSWVVDQKLEQPLQLGDKDTDEDPTPQQTAFKYADTLANQLPTIWNKPPKLLPADGSYIYLVDGQRLAFNAKDGAEAQFKLKAIGIRTITVTHRAGTPQDIPLSDVLSIKFAD